MGGSTDLCQPRSWKQHRHVGHYFWHWEVYETCRCITQFARWSVSTDVDVQQTKQSICGSRCLFLTYAEWQAQNSQAQSNAKAYDFFPNGSQRAPLIIVSRMSASLPLISPQADQFAQLLRYTLLRIIVTAGCWQGPLTDSISKSPLRPHLQ